MSENETFPQKRKSFSTDELLSLGGAWLAAAIGLAVLLYGIWQ